MLHRFGAEKHSKAKSSISAAIRERKILIFAADASGHRPGM
jgi:hypothetical protein